MRALEITKFGGPEVLKIKAIDSPSLFPRGVRIRVKAAGVNFADIIMRVGLYPEAPKPPFIPGYEVSGEVIEVGSEVTTVKAGDRVVAGCKFGGYCSETVLDEDFVKKLPNDLSFEEAASIPVNFMTASIALEDMARVREGDRVLIPNAAGGVGIAAVQIARNAGAEVIGLVGSLRKADTVLSLGAREVMTYEDWEKKDQRKFDIILDASGGHALKVATQRLAPCGRVVNFGISSGIQGQTRNLFKLASMFVSSPIFLPVQLMMKNIGVYGLNVLPLFAPPDGGKPIEVQRAFTRLMKSFESHQLKAVIGKTFPLDEGGAAHEYLQSRANIGKVVLTV